MEALCCLRLLHYQCPVSHPRPFHEDKGGTIYAALSTKTVLPTKETRGKMN